MSEHPESGPHIPVQDRQLRQALQAARFRLLTDPERGALPSRTINESFDRATRTFEGAAVRSFVPILVEKAVRAEFGA
jgi:hypothetical protein